MRLASVQVKQSSDALAAIQPDDSWLPTQISWTTGQNVTWPFYFQIVPAGQALTGAESRLAEFQMIQTAPPATLSAAFAASSAAISASSVLAVLASASSLSSLGSALGAGVTTLAPGELASYSSAIAGLSSGLSEAVSGGRPTSQSTRGSLASDSNDDGGFPAYGIAILAVLGGFLLIFALATAFLLLRLHRRRQRSGSQDSEAALKQPILGANGEGELQSPIEKDGGSPTSDRGGFPATVAGAAAAGGAIAARSRGPTDSRGRSSAGDGTVGEDSAISTTDAALMAEAFRKALRAPEFPAGGSNDHSPSSGTGTVAASSSEQAAFAAAAEANSSAAARPRSRLSSTAVDEGGEAEQAGRELIDKELASEGRSMRSVTDLKRAALVDADRGEGPRRPPSLPPSP